jgi:allophanate hydrolase
VVVATQPIVDALGAVLDRIECASDPAVWIFRPPRAELLARASALDALADDERVRRPLLGVPFAVKDNIDVAGWPTTAGCPAFAYVAARSATVVERLELAGAIPVGKTNMDQFATGLVGTRSPYGIPRNPIDPAAIPGGSSSGSAVAVASGLVPFALGTDTAGSGRVPAACTGIVGLKPTYGIIPTDGVVPACASLDCVSIFARSVDEAVRVLDAVRGTDAPAAPAPPRRLAVPRPEQRRFCGDADAEHSFARTLDALRAAGFTVDPVDFTPFAEAGALLYDGPFVAERTAAVGDFIAAHPGEVLPLTRAIIEGGRAYSAVDLARGQQRLRELRRATAPVFASAAALVVPTIPRLYRVAEVLAEPLALNAALGTYTNFVNLLDLCALAIPSDRYPDGRPIGITLIGPAHADAAVAILARAAASALCYKVRAG